MDTREHKNETTEAIRRIAGRIIESEGMELCHVEFIKQGKTMVVRVYIDKEGGVTLNNCVEINKQLGIALDVENFIDHHYILEVSSPGINRLLVKEKDFIKYAGNRIKIHTYQPINNRRNFDGSLKGLDNGKVIIETDDHQLLNIDFNNISKAKLNRDIKI